LGQWSDNFDTYTPGPLIPQSTWEAWANDPNAGNFEVSTEQAYNAPHSVKCDGPDDAVHQYSGYTSGVWRYNTWMWIPSNPGTGSTYFILCNTYDGGGPTNNWSTQIAFDPTLGTVTSEFDGDAWPILVTGQWVELTVIIDLGLDQQTIRYDGFQIDQKSWTEGVSGGGALNIGCVDLWANNTSWPVYYDNMELVVQEAIGACCFLDGTCQETDPADCTNLGGDYQGHGTLCASTNCPTLGPCGWVYEAPFIVTGDTCGDTNDCALKASNDTTFEVVIPYASDWTFSICDVAWDSWLYVGVDCCGDDWVNDDAPGCGTGSEITILDLQPGTYFIAIEGYSQSTCGPFTLVVSSPCEAPCDPAGVPEPEPPCENNVPDTTNVGCNGATPPEQVFTPLECGQIYCGTSGNFVNGGVNTRDMDWYEFTISETSVVHWIGIGEFDVQMWLIDITLGCDNSTTVASQGGDPCATVDVAGAVDPGTYTGVISTQDFTGWDCGVEYEVRLTCEPLGNPCPADVNGDQVVDVLDLLAVLADWGSTAGGSTDINNDGVVDVLDLLEVLAAWGPC
jgi:hypothetical protein